MAEEGRPTGITRDDVARLGAVEFEEGRAQLWRQSRVNGSVRLELETFTGLRIALYGYYVRGEFVEVDRQRLD